MHCHLNVYVSHHVTTSIFITVHLSVSLLWAQLATRYSRADPEIFDVLVAKGRHTIRQSCPWGSVDPQVGLCWVGLCRDF